MKYRNPYFIGILSAIIVITLRLLLVCIAILILLESFLQCSIWASLLGVGRPSQSLFYWNPFCNDSPSDKGYRRNMIAILILLESFLQSINKDIIQRDISIAILILLESFLQSAKIQYLYDLNNIAILILLESFLQLK